MTTNAPPITLEAIALRLELVAGLRLNATTLGADEWGWLLRRLMVRDARVVVLTILHGLSARDIAERLECSITRVQQRWLRAVRRLRRDGAVAEFGQAVLGGRGPRVFVTR